MPIPTTWIDYQEPAEPYLCPDCGRPIKRNPRSAEGLWNHIGDDPADCWRISYDGPGEDPYGDESPAERDARYRSEAQHG